MRQVTAVVPNGGETEGARSSVSWTRVGQSYIVITLCAPLKWRWQAYDWALNDIEQLIGLTSAKPVLLWVLSTFTDATWIGRRQRDTRASKNKARVQGVVHFTQLSHITQDRDKEELDAAE